MTKKSRSLICGVFSSVLALGQQTQVLLSPVPFLKPDGSIPISGQDTGVFFDVKNSQAVVFYRPVDDAGETGGPTKRFVVQLSNQIDPEVSSSISRKGSQYIYTFTLSNRAGSKQAINRIAFPHLMAGSVLESGGSTGWQTVSAAPSLEWVAQGGAASVPPGGKSVLTVASDKKPGLIQAIMQGQTTPSQIPEDMPKELRAELKKLTDSPMNGKLYLTFGPKYSSDTPQSAIREDFEATINFLTQLHQLNAGSAAVKQIREDMNQSISFATGKLSDRAHTQREAELNNDMLVALGSQ